MPIDQGRINSLATSIRKRTLDLFFVVDVNSLPDYHYTSTDSECGICRDDGEADVPESGMVVGNILVTDVIEIRDCKHSFHKLCLKAWLHSLLRLDQDGTCPICRRTLVVPHDPAAITDVITTYRQHNDVMRGDLQHNQQELEALRHAGTHTPTAAEAEQIQTLEEEIEFLQVMLIHIRESVAWLVAHFDGE